MEHSSSDSKNTWDAHIHVLPERRKEYSIKAGETIMKWIKSNLKGSLIYTSMPKFCLKVRDFLFHFGFKQIGILEGAWLKNGVQHDMWILTW